MHDFFTLDFRYADNISLAEKEQERTVEAACKAQSLLESQSGPGNEFLGWLELPSLISPDLLAEIESVAALMQKAEALLVIGIGGSYLGSKAVLTALQAPFKKPKLPLYFAGHHLDASYHQELLELLREKRYALNIISKSGTTTEPALAFRLFWENLSRNFSTQELRELVFVTTDAKKGSLRKFVEKYNLRSFVIPEDVGGRYSVFTPVGLVPLAAAGISVSKLIEGACAMRAQLRSTDFNKNPALQYAAYRNRAYHQAGKKIEILVSYQQNLSYLCEWWKQLFGESEGKTKNCIFPAAVTFTTDLHSLGQWIQEGEPNIFQTVLDIENVEGPLIPATEDNIDGLNYLEGKKLHSINRSATEATLSAHQAGQVPCLCIRIPALNEETLGALLYFFEYSCALSAYMFGLNPFDQPGVEAYKQNMFRLLAKL